MSEVLHGGNLTQAMKMYGGLANEWLDLSTGINPKSWPVGNIPSTVWHQLPDIGEEALLIAAARCYYQVHRKYDVLCFNGAQAIIQLLPRLSESKCKVDIVQPTYGEHDHCWRREGHFINIVSGIEDMENPDIAIIVNPNNPDGNKINVESLLSLAHRLDRAGGKLVVDEAFGDTFPQSGMASFGIENIILLKSFGKFFGLGGLRLGFAIASKNIIEKLWCVRGPWAVNGPALHIGIRALMDSSWIDKTRQWILSQADKQEKLLTGCGLEVTGNAGLFLQTSHVKAAKIHDQLMERYILTRRFPERSQFLRFGLCGNNNELQRLKRELERILNG